MCAVLGCATTPTSPQKPIRQESIPNENSEDDTREMTETELEKNENTSEKTGSVVQKKISDNTSTKEPPETISANFPITEEKKGEKKRDKNRRNKKDAKKKNEQNEDRKETQTDRKEKKQIITLESILAEKKNFTSQATKVQFCKTLNENSNLFSVLTLSSFNVQATTTVKKEIEEPFKAKLNIDNPDLIKNIKFIVEYPVKTATTSSFSYTSIKAGEDGVLAFTPPKSDFSIDGEVRVYLDILNGDEMQENVQIMNENIAESLKSKLITSFSYKVATDNRRISAAIAILDHDKDGKAILSENIIANKLFVKMMRSGFSRAGLAPFESLDKLQGDAIIAQAKEFFKNAVEYYIFGKSYITKLEKNEDNTWECKVECILYVWNLKQNKKVLEFNLSRTEKGKSQGDAVRKTRINMGEQEMYNKLLYNL